MALIWINYILQALWWSLPFSAEASDVSVRNLCLAAFNIDLTIVASKVGIYFSHSSGSTRVPCPVWMPQSLKSSMPLTPYVFHTAILHLCLFLFLLMPQKHKMAIPSPTSQTHSRPENPKYLPWHLLDRTIPLGTMDQWGWRIFSSKQIQVLLVISINVKWAAGSVCHNWKLILQKWFPTRAYVIFSNPYVLSIVGLEVYINGSMALFL